MAKEDLLKYKSFNIFGRMQRVLFLCTISKKSKLKNRLKREWSINFENGQMLKVAQSLGNLRKSLFFTT